MKRAHVVLVPLSTRLARRQRFEAAREALAGALRASGELGGAARALPYDEWPREPHGAPQSIRGWHASWTDTRGLVAALVAETPIAIDSEWLLRPRWEVARERFREEGDLERLADPSPASVLGLWCAKEALLKLAGVGLADLARCPLLEHRREGDRQLFRLAYEGGEPLVRVRSAAGGGQPRHLVAWACPEPVELELHALQEVG